MINTAWQGQVPERHHSPSARPSVKQARPGQGAKPEALVPASGSNLGAKINSGEQVIWESEHFQTIQITR